MLFKRLRKRCLCTGCVKKATHFGICGVHSNGLCDEHYKEFYGIVDKLKDCKEQLENIK